MQTLRTTRYLDNQGRITLPIEFRKELKLRPEDTIILSLTTEGILLAPQNKKCKICGTTLPVDYNKPVCPICCKSYDFNG